MSRTQRSDKPDGPIAPLAEPWTSSSRCRTSVGGDLSHITLTEHDAACPGALLVTGQRPRSRRMHALAAPRTIGYDVAARQRAAQWLGSAATDEVRRTDAVSRVWAACNCGGVVTTISFSLASLVLGALLGVWIPIFIQRPKIRASGSGTSPASSDPSLSYFTLSIENEPGFFGLNIGRTVVLGRHIWGAKRIGLALDRNPATCSAYIVPAAGGEGRSVPVWSESIRPKADGTLVVPGGENARVYLFAKRRGDDSCFYLFTPEAWGDARPTPVISEAERGFDSTTAFVVHVSYAGGAHEHRIPVTVKRTIHGSWQVEISYGKQSSGASSFS